MFNNRKNKNGSGDTGADLASFENEIVDLGKTGVMPELNEGFWDEPLKTPIEDAEEESGSETEENIPDEAGSEEYYTEEIALGEADSEEYYTEEIVLEDYGSEEVDDDFDAKYADEEFATAEIGVPVDEPGTEYEEYSEEYAEGDYDDQSDEYDEAAEAEDEYTEAEYSEPEYDEPEAEVSPADDEYIDLDKSMAEHDEPHSISISAPSKKTLMTVLIAAAVIALAFLGVYAFKGRKAGAPSSSGTYVNGIYVSEAMQGAGNEISDIGMIGERGLVAALDARMAASVASNDITAPDDHTTTTDYGEAALTTSMRVSIELVTVKSDLKIKFLNSETGKLIPNVPFKVSITDPSGKKSQWTDDDLDGIIYKTSLAEGKYTVHIEPLEGDKYAGYTWPSDKSANVKSTIAYSSINVKDEVKNANQVNEAAEDTASRGGTSQLDSNDTVAFVESSSEPAYKEISKDSITNPSASLDLNGIGFDPSMPYSVVVGADASGNDDQEKEKEPEKPAEKPTIKLTLSADTQKVSVGSSCTFTVNTSVTVAPGCEVTVESLDASVATASISDKTVTVKALKAGTADIKVTATTTTSDTVKEKATATAKCTVTVTAAVDMSTPLKDKSGNEVYVLEDGKYRKATYADYAKFDKFYILSGTKYTGWQTIGGSTYYYDKDGKPVTGTQVIQGVTYQFGADGKMQSTSGVLGIDVSKWQGNIDWNAVKAAGVQYVIIRVGYRGSTAGALIDDSKFASNIQGAKAAGLGVGVYFVTQAVNDVEAVYEASMVIDRIKGYSLEYPVFLDVEPSGGRGDLIDKATRTAVCIAFCETIRNAGYTPGIYANKTWFETKMNASQLSSYKIWVAHYSSVCGYTGRYDYWQYTDKGRVAGISGNVDYDLKYT